MNQGISLETTDQQHYYKSVIPISAENHQQKQKIPIELNKKQDLDPPVTATAFIKLHILDRPCSITHENPITRTLQEDFNSSLDKRTSHNEQQDNESEYCHTYSTSSTDYNRENNVLRFYKEHQQQILTTTTEPQPSPTTFANKRKRHFRLCGLIRKMRLTAEKPFWKINKHFC